MGASHCSHVVSALDNNLLYLVCEKEVVSYSLENFALVQRFIGHAYMVNSIVIVKDSLFTLTNSVLREFNKKTGELIKFYDNSYSAITHSTTKAHLLAALQSGNEIHSIAPNTSEVNILSLPNTDGSSINILINHSQPNFHNRIHHSHTNDEKSGSHLHVVAANKGHVYLLNYSEHKAPSIQASIESGATSIQSALLLPNHYIAVGHENGSIDLFHGENGAKPIQTVTPSTGSIYNIVANSDYSVIAIGGADGKIYIYLYCHNETDEAKLVEKYGLKASDTKAYPKLVLFQTLEGHTSELLCIQFHEATAEHKPMSHHLTHVALFSSAKDKTLKQWLFNQKDNKYTCIQTINTEENVKDFIFNHYPLNNNFGVLQSEKSIFSNTTGDESKHTHENVLFTLQANRLHIYSLTRRAELQQPISNNLQLLYVYYNLLVNTNYLGIRTDFRNLYETFQFDSNNGKTLNNFTFPSAFFYPFSTINNDKKQNLLLRTRANPTSEIKTDTTNNPKLNGPEYNTGIIECLDLADKDGKVLNTFNSPTQLSHFLYSNNTGNIFCRMYSTATIELVNDIYVVNLNNGNRSIINTEQKQITAYSLDDTSNILVTGSSDNQVKIWSTTVNNTGTNNPIFTTTVSGPVNYITSITIDTVSIIVIGADNGEITVISGKTGSNLYNKSHNLKGHTAGISTLLVKKLSNDKANEMKLDNNTVIVISGSKDHTVKQFRFTINPATTETNIITVESSVEYKGYKGYNVKILNLEISPDFNTLFSSSTADCGLFCHDFISGKLLGQYTNTSMIQYLQCLNDYLYYGSETVIGAVEIKSFQQGKIVQKTMVIEKK